MSTCRAKGHDSTTIASVIDGGHSRDYIAGRMRAVFIYVGSNSACQLVLGIFVLAWACAVPEQARDNSLPVPMDEYVRTLSALEQYRVLAAEDDGEILPETDKPVQPGEHYDGVPRLIRLLRRIGDLTGDADSTVPDLYQGELVAAVQRFQVRHGLEPNGWIDKATLAQLNTPLSFRVHQLELALERWHRHPYNPSCPAIVLNLPEFRLRAFGASNRRELEMKIVVGQGPEHKTPLLSSQLEAVIFRPYWNVPVSIQCNELVPEITKDASFLSANHLEMITLQGVVVQEAVTSDVLAHLCSGNLRLRQTPGPKNVLGLVEFAFPNKYEVYMHGTSAQWLFARERRDLSHGCVRLERAEDLAEWVLRQESGWTREHVAKAMQGPESFGVRLRRPIQVVTMYVTAVTLENGEVHFFQDIYGEDAALEKELAGTQLLPSRR
jgi:murein L,D-transpeptidase YcbB/YkuD